MALRNAICRCGGWSSQWVKYAASSRLLATLSGSSCATRRRSSSIDTPSKYSRAVVTVLRHYNRSICQNTGPQDRGYSPPSLHRLMKQPRRVETVTQCGMSPVPLEASRQTLSVDPLTSPRELDEGSAPTQV